ncbi:PREDICTED: hematopoietically-expressed homeobox protein HHEX [Nipponia nippon]|uniref:hematopoietically-expressed homeobox protein HHEX n=1 Tax=Nipponia nippon TaxID=128390 RepID=UPI000510CC6D|nr:PREDICTED: hematopoietically-expressed homeobox protein HHEX [Nipponia nippon]
MPLCNSEENSGELCHTSAELNSRLEKLVSRKSNHDGEEEEDLRSEYLTDELSGRRQHQLTSPHNARCLCLEQSGFHSVRKIGEVKTWFQNRRAKWRRLKQENPQATKKEVEGADSHSDQRLESCPTPEQKGKEVSLDGSQYTPSPASQEDLESDVSDDSDQEVDIEGDKGYYNPTH